MWDWGRAGPADIQSWMRDILGLKTNPTTFGTATKSFVFAIPTSKVGNIKPASIHVHIWLVPGGLSGFFFVNANAKVGFITETVNVWPDGDVRPLADSSWSSGTVDLTEYLPQQVGPWKTMQPIYSALKSLMIRRMLFPQLCVAAKDYILITSVN